jgi:3',5'-cyclic AMP phosphodiesterase CpdA
MRIAITSDVHFHPPWRDRIERLADILKEQRPDLMVLAGDMGEPLDLFEQGLRTFQGVAEHRAIVAGNHDVWHRTGEHTSQELWETALPQIAFQYGYHWLEYRNLIMGSLGICGTVAWYDYSGRHPNINLDENAYEQIKASISNDGRFIDWPWTDREFAGQVGAQFGQRLRMLQQSPEITDILVITHVPLYRESLRIYETDEQHIANAYYANLPLGRVVLKYDKVRAVFSGHVHVDRHYTVVRENGLPLAVYGIPSDYGAPAALIWDSETQEVIPYRVLGEEAV